MVSVKTGGWTTGRTSRIGSEGSEGSEGRLGQVEGGLFASQWQMAALLGCLFSQRRRRHRAAVCGRERAGALAGLALPTAGRFTDATGRAPILRAAPL